MPFFSFSSSWLAVLGDQLLLLVFDPLRALQLWLYFPYHPFLAHLALMAQPNLARHHHQQQLPPSVFAPLAHQPFIFPSPNSVFRFLDLPIELQLELIHSIAQLSIASSTAANHHRLISEDALVESDLVLPIDWSLLVNLAQTCRSLYKLCSPYYLRRLTISARPRSRPPQPHSETPDLFTLCNIHANNPALPHVTTLYYHGPRRNGHGLNLASHSTSETIGATQRLLCALPQLRALCLIDVEGALVSGLLTHPLPTLEALSLSYVTVAPSASPPSSPASRVDPSEFPCLKRLRALKIQECCPSWLALAKATTNLEHLCIWMPAHHIRDINWFIPEVLLPKLRYLNLDGFRMTPRLLVQLCERIRNYRASGAIFVIEELDLEARFTRTLVNTVLEAVQGHTALRSLALSCVVEREMGPDLLKSIYSAGLGHIQRLLIMVERYEGRRWPGELDCYASQLARFGNLRSFAFNHVESNLGLDLEEDEDAELVIVGRRQPAIAQKFANHAKILFDTVPSLNSVILVKALWANRADGARAWRCSEKVEIEDSLDLREMLIPFEPRWTD